MRILPAVTPRPEVLAPPARPGIVPPAPADIVAPSMPPKLQELLGDQAVLDVRLGHGTLGQVLPDTIRFRFTGDGPLADRQIVPESDAARKLLAGEKGSAVADALKGALQTLGARGQEVKLTGLTMARSTDGFLGNLLVTHAEGELGSGGDVTVDDVEAVADELLQSGIDQAYGVYDGAGWMHLDPSTTREFDQLIAAGPDAPVRQGELIPTLQHELEHAVTPSLDDDFRKVPWLEEATAETLTQWVGATAEMASAMKLPQKSSGVIAYEPQVRELHGWLERAGLDPADASQLGVARDLLQGRRLGEVPGAIAAKIVEHEGSGDAAKLTAEIEKSFAENAFLGGIGGPEDDEHGHDLGGAGEAGGPDLGGNIDELISLLELPHVSVKRA